MRRPSILTLVARLVADFTCCNHALVQQVMNGPPAYSQWLVLGPFQIGTREAPWGADPLEKYGGFPALWHDPEADFRSSLAPNGTVRWAVQKAKLVDVNGTHLKVSLEISFPNIDWTALQSAYGWSALQYQAWVRGSISVGGDLPRRVLFHADQVMEYAIDGSRVFGGDMYGFRRAPLVVTLEPGSHIVDVRLIRDVRAMGGVGAPNIQAALDLRTVSEELSAVASTVVVSDVVDGRLASEYGSIAVCNQGAHWIELLGFSCDANIRASFVRLDVIRLAPGQTRPVAFKVSLSGAHVKSSTLGLMYRSDAAVSELLVSLKFNHRSMYEPHKVTHLHPGGIVSYAVLRPPSPSATCKSNQHSAPVLLQLHGAGLEADSDTVAHALDPLPDLCVWVLFPTGVTPWSADDWHTWGIADVRSAIESIPSWIATTRWTGIGVDIEKWLVSGHSNGGQGTTYISTHWPDNVIASAPVSGYVSIPQYVPYQFWRPTEPKRRAVVDAALNSGRLELMVENAKSVPIHQQHGSEDDNVPVYHSRLVYQLLGEVGSVSNYTEVTGGGHWFDGVMTTDNLKRFYESALDNSADNVEEDVFTLIVANPADTGSKNGFKVLHLKDPSQFGRLRVEHDREARLVKVKTENVLDFAVDANTFGTWKQQLTIDGQACTSVGLATTPISIVFWQQRNDRIEECAGLEKCWRCSLQEKSPAYLRTGRQLGGIDAILRTQGPFIISYTTPKAFNMALQISRNLHTYFYADSEISSAQCACIPPQNCITVVIGTAVPECRRSTPFAIQPSPAPHRLLVRNHEGYWHRIVAEEGSLGAVWVQPLSDERLELMVWGEDEEGLAQAARLVPTTTGVGVPDFVVVDGKTRYRGVDGVLAMGFFDAWWNITSSSYIGG